MDLQCTPTTPSKNYMSIGQNKLSFSQVSMYSTCGQKYKYYYIDKIREKSFTAFLPFGSAVDQALNYVLNSKKQGFALDLNVMLSTFDKAWSRAEINGKVCNVKFNPDIGYRNDDYMEELLTPEDKKKIYFAVRRLAPRLSKYPLNNIRDILESEKKEKTQKGADKNLLSLLNFMTWISMRHKGHLMLKAYVEELLPKIDEVLEVQHKVELKNETGDSIVGYIDALIKVNGELVVMDNKTSSSFYEFDDVFFSPQLAQYCFMTGAKKAAFAVMLKSINLNKRKVCKDCGHEGKGSHKTCDSVASGKRCGGEWKETYDPKAKTQWFIDLVPEHTQNLVLDNFDAVNTGIKNKIFVKNFNACHNSFGQKCPYINLCWKGHDKNLVKVQNETRRS